MRCKQGNRRTTIYHNMACVQSQNITLKVVEDILTQLNKKLEIKVQLQLIAEMPGLPRHEKRFGMYPYIKNA